MLDETEVREHAEVHAQAVVKGDLATAGSGLTDGAKEQAPEIMKSLPSPLTGAGVTSIESAGNQFVVRIRYTGESGDVVVESRWIEQDGHPRAADLKVV